MKIFNYEFDKGTIILITGIVLIFTGIFVYSSYRNNLINDKGIIVPAKIVEIRNNVKKGITTREDVVIFTYTVRNKEYKKSVSYNDYETLEVGYCFELQVVEDNPEMALINLKNRIECK